MDSDEKSGGITTNLLLPTFGQSMPPGRDIPTGFAELGFSPRQPDVNPFGGSSDLPTFHGEFVPSLSPRPSIGSGHAPKAIDDATATAVKALLGNWVAGGDACPHTQAGSKAEPLRVLGAKAPIARTPLREDQDELDRKYEIVLARLGDAIGALRLLLSRGQDHLSASARALGRIERALKRPCRFVIFGERNSGKSTLANVLMGRAILPTNIASNTRIPTLLCHSVQPHLSAFRPNGELQQLSPRSVETGSNLPYLCVGLPIPSLKALEIVDLPGLDEQHAYTQEDLLRAHRADIALWCTIADQAWTSSERAYWASQPVWLKRRSLLVVTHGDLLESSAEAEHLVARLRLEAAGEFRDVILLSGLGSLALGSDATYRAATGVDKLDTLLLTLAFEVRTRRIEAAMRICSSISERVMMTL